MGCTKAVTACMPLVSQYAFKMLVKKESEGMKMTIVEEKRGCSWKCAVSDHHFAISHTVTVCTDKASIEEEELRQVVVKKLGWRHSDDACLVCEGIDELKGPRLNLNQWNNVLEKLDTRELKLRVLRAFGMMPPNESTNSNPNYYSDKVLTDSLTLLIKYLSQNDEKTVCDALCRRGWVPVKPNKRHGTDMVQCDECEGKTHHHCAGIAYDTSKAGKEKTYRCWHCLLGAKMDPAQRLLRRHTITPHGTPIVALPMPHNLSDGSVVFLRCTCLETIGEGLPCAHILGVAGRNGWYLSYRCFHRFWWSDRVFDAIEPKPLFKLAAHRIPEAEIDFFDQDKEKRRAHKRSNSALDFVGSEEGSGDSNDEDDREGVKLPPGKSGRGRNRSRRFKTKK